MNSGGSISGCEVWAAADSERTVTTMEECFAEKLFKLGGHFSVVISRNTVYS